MTVLDCLKVLTLSAVGNGSRILRNQFFVVCKCPGGHYQLSTLSTAKCPAPGTHRATNARGLPWGGVLAAGIDSHINLDRRTPVHLSNRVIAFNQSKRSEWFRRILYFISLSLKWQCSKRNGPCFSCASIELWMHLGSWESTQEAREALGFASCHSNASLVLSQLPASIHNSIDARQAWTRHFLSGCQF